jgi:hypothetical protein
MRRQVPAIHVESLANQTFRFGSVTLIEAQKAERDQPVGHLVVIRARDGAAAFQRRAQQRIGRIELT